MPQNLIVNYLEKQIAKGNLVEWTVVMANVQSHGKQPSNSQVHGTSSETLVIGPSVRGSNEDSDSEFYVANKAAVSGPSYESLDLSDEEYTKALDMTVKEWEKAVEEGKTKKKTKPTSPFANCSKAVRKKTKGLLLLFNMDFGDNKTGVFTYVMSLPMLADKDDTAISYEYMGNKNAFKILDEE